jgi:hypothetical protein
LITLFAAAADVGIVSKLVSLGSQKALTQNRRFQLHKRTQLFIGSHDEALIATMRVSNPDRSPVGIHR